ncbi:MAG: NnrU family protein [Pseudomonadota bacterium]|nr:NnrU family protein [Pseudomonadota bacterium]
MTNLIAAAVAFLLLHLVVSGTRVRDAATGALGQGAYLGLFSLASVGLLIWLGIAYGAAWSGPGDTAYWHATTATRWIQLLVQLVAFLFVVPGLMTRNPTSVAQEGALDNPDVVRGMLRITRHPFLWGVAIWAAGHLMVNGDMAGIILFGTMLVLALFGTASIDAKRARASRERWNAFAAQTSNIPFAAIAAGRQSLNIGEIGWVRLVAALAVWAVILGAHPHIFGVSALP